MKPKLSIIIPTWNTAEITYKCLDSIKKFLPPDYAQVIVVDNASTDNTQKLIGSLPGIIYIQNSENLGFSRANNIGAKQALADTLLFLNSDMVLIDNSLIKMTGYLNSIPKIGIIGPQFLNEDFSIQGSVLPPQTPINAIREFWFGQQTYSKYAPTSKHPVSVSSISGGALMIKRQLFKDMGGWDERYFFYGEDLEICRQAKALSRDIIYYPDCRVIHQHGASGKKIQDPDNQWRRQIPSSKIYHGLFEHYLLFFITWSAQKLHLVRTK